jgi:uncharacterized membrane protein YraQ (UPF0718 family)
VNVTLLIMLAIAVALTVAAYLKGPSVPLEGLRAGGRLFLGVLPSMIVAFIAAGMIGQVLPRELMTRWLGEESGVMGLIIASVAGAFTPGGPFVQFPIVASLLKAGAGVAPLMTYLTAWSLLGVNRILVYEIPLLGPKLAFSRIAACLLLPFLVGLLTRFFWLRVF